MARLNEGAFLQWPDGCDVAQRCLECPLQVCRFDGPKSFQVRLRQVRDLVIYRRHRAGECVPDIARSMGLHVRTAWRALASYERERPEFTPAEVGALLPLAGVGLKRSLKELT